MNNESNMRTNSLLTHINIFATRYSLPEKIAEIGVVIIQDQPISFSISMTEFIGKQKELHFLHRDGMVTHPLSGWTEQTKLELTEGTTLECTSIHI